MCVCPCPFPPQPEQKIKGGLQLPASSGGRAGEEGEPAARSSGSALGLDKLATEMRERRGRAAPPPRAVVSVDFESDEASTVRSMLPPPLEPRAPGATGSDDGAAVGEGVGKKRPRSFKVTPVGGKDEGRSWDGSNFGEYTTSTFTAAKVAGRPDGRARWGGGSVGGTSVGSTLTGRSDTPLSQPGTVGWSGAGGESVPGSVLPRDPGALEDEQRNFDREFYQMDVRPPLLPCCLSV